MDTGEGPVRTTFLDQNFKNQYKINQKGQNILTPKNEENSVIRIQEKYVKNHKYFEDRVIQCSFF